MNNYILGIDLGTTSVKVTVINGDTKELVEHYTKDTNCEVPNNIEGGHEQHVPTIISTLNICVSKISDCLRKRISKIGVCGQMHGVLFWKIAKWQPPWIFQGKTYRIDENSVSRLYTWQDSRCDSGFLASLPKPDSHLGISSGYGIPTTFWIKRNRPDFLKKYNRSGLISSFVAAMLTDQDTVYTSYQNAASWGYFNCRDLEWNIKILERADFPIELLPRLRPSRDIIGTLKNNWHNIPEGIPVGVDLGDLQCSVLSTINAEQEAVINFSTSAQIAYIVNNFIPPNGPPLVNPISYWPYFDNQFVAVAPSLNGGNVLTLFVNMITGWLSEFGESVDQDDIWKRLISLGLEDKTQSNLQIKPTCMGERFDTSLTASVRYATGNNVPLGHVFRVLCTGLIQNLNEMLPAKVLKAANIKRLVGNGQSLQRNMILKNEIERIYQLPLVIGDGDASKGAALAMSVGGCRFTDSSVSVCHACPLNA